MKHIFHLIPDLGLGGAQRALCYLAGAMDHSRFRLTVAYWGADHDLCHALGRAGVEVVRLDGVGASLLRLAEALARELRLARPDILHTHLFDADLVGVLTAQILGIRHCCSTIHSFSFFSTRFHRWRYRWLLGPFVSRFFPVSRALGAFLVQRCRVPASQVQVILNGINTAAFAGSPQRQQSAGADPVIGTLARLDSRKGIRFLVDAFARLQQRLPDARLIVGGAGEEREGLERLVEALGVARRVAFIGRVRNPEEFYRQLDCFVLPSLDEGFGLVVLEAMAAGLPVIATRVGGVPEIIEHGRNGLLVEPADAGAIADAIHTLCASPEQRKRLVEGARQTSLRFDIVRTAAEVQLAYEALL
jgi:glycosyltransferase involved in cell wall biosynthesis